MTGSLRILHLFSIKGDKGNQSNYRPISLTAICCNIMEHLVFYPVIKASFHVSSY